MKIVVIGAKGQLGHEIMRLASGSEHEFVAADVCGDGADVLRIDMTDAVQVEALVSDDVDVVINGDYVAEHLGSESKTADMKRYIL